MSDASADAPTPRWWPGRTNAIISALLATLAVPLLVCAVWMFVMVLGTVPCDRAAHLRDSDPCNGEGIAAAVYLILGTFTLVVGGSMAMGVAGLLLWPGLRGRVMLVIATLIIGSPIVFLLAVKLIWIPLG